MIIQRFMYFSISGEVVFDFTHPNQAPDIIFGEEDEGFEVDLSRVPVSIYGWSRP